VSFGSLLFDRLAGSITLVTPSLGDLRAWAAPRGRSAGGLVNAVVGVGRDARVRARRGAVVLRGQRLGSFGWGGGGGGGGGGVVVSDDRRLSSLPSGSAWGLPVGRAGRYSAHGVRVRRPGGGSSQGRLRRRVASGVAGSDAGRVGWRERATPLRRCVTGLAPLASQLDEDRGSFTR